MKSVTLLLKNVLLLKGYTYFFKILLYEIPYKRASSVDKMVYFINNLINETTGGTD